MGTLSTYVAQETHYKETVCNRLHAIFLNRTSIDPVNFVSVVMTTGRQNASFKLRYPLNDSGTWMDPGRSQIISFNYLLKGLAQPPKVPTRTS